LGRIFEKRFRLEGGMHGVGESAVKTCIETGDRRREEKITCLQKKIRGGSDASGVKPEEKRKREFFRLRSLGWG